MMFLALGMDTWLIIMWIVIMVLAATLEIITTDLVSIWLAIGALAALIIAFWDGQPWIQFTVFFAVSIGSIIISRPFVKKIQKTEIVHTNADKLIGQLGVVTEKILPNQIGEVKIDGRLWSAVSTNDKTHNVGDEVKIEAISGVKLIVSSVKNDQNLKNL